MADGPVTIEVELTKEQLEKGLKSLKSDLNSLEKSTSGISSKLSKGLSSIGNVATKAGTALTVGLTTPLIALGAAGVKYNAQMEDFEANLTTLLGSADKAKDMLNDLKEMANTTPFETSDLLEATQMMLGFGLAADKTQGYLQTLGDISMGNSEKLMSLTRAFSQIGAAGKATMEDINQMIDAGFNPLQIMSETTGKSMADLREEVSAGEVSFEDIAEAMRIATSEGGRYYNAMEKASQTMNGKLSTAIDALKTALGNLTQSLLPIVTKIVEKITEWANAFANLDQGTQETILKIAGLLAIAGPVLSVVGKVSSGVSSLISVLGGLGSAALPVTLAIAGLVAGLYALVQALGGPQKAFEKFKNVLNKCKDILKDFLDKIQFSDKLQKINKKISELSGKLNGLKDLFKVLGVIFTVSIAPAILLITGLIGGLINAIDPFLDYVGNLIDVLSGLGEIIVGIFTFDGEKILGGLKKTFGGIVGVIIAPFKMAGSFISGFFEGIGSFISTALGNITNTIKNSIVNTWESIKNFFINGWNSIVAFFTETIPQWIQNVITWFQQLPYNIGLLIGQIFGHIANFGVSVWNWITVDLPQIIQGIIDWFAQLPGRIWEWLQNTINNIARWGQETWTAATTWVSNTVNSIINWFSQLPGRIWTWLTNTINNVINWGKDLANRGKEAAQNLFNNIVDTIQNLPSKLAEIGKNLVEGLWNGITSAGNWLKDKISSFANGVVDGFKNTFGIHSPSKIMNKEIGRYLALGLGEGFNDNIKSVYSKMKSAVEFETQKLSASLSTTATTNKVLTANITVNPSDIYMDSTKVGRVVTPAVTKTLRGAGAY